MKTVNRGDLVGVNWKVNEVIKTKARLKQILGNENPNEKLGIVTKSGRLQLVGESFLFNKKNGNGASEEAINEYLDTIIERGVFVCVHKDCYKNEIPPQMEVVKDDVYGYSDDTSYNNAIRNEQVTSIWAWVIGFNLISIVIIGLSINFYAYLPNWYHVALFLSVLIINLKLFYKLNNIK